MVCGCVAGIQAKLGPNKVIREVFSINKIDGVNVPVVMPRIFVFYKKGGRLCREATPRTIDLIFCPWCGTRYIPENTRSPNV